VGCLRGRPRVDSWQLELGMVQITMVLVKLEFRGQRWPYARASPPNALDRTTIVGIL